jgi:dCMP deaminase
MINNWDRMYMDMTVRASLESKCSAKQVGCLLVRNNNILAVGINGTFSGAQNCRNIFRKQNGIWKERNPKSGEYITDIFNPESGFNEPVYQPEWIRCEDQEAHHKWSLVNEVHAEMNALAKANKNGVSVEGATAYVTHSPCYNCAKNLYTFGINRILYKHEYDDIYKVRDLLKDLNIELIHLREN